MKHFLLLVSFALVVILGCESETPTANNNNSIGTGTVIGHVDALNEFSELLPDQAGTTITLEGTSHSAQTDSLGNWTLNGVPTGSYYGIYTRNGYVTKKIRNIEVFPNTVHSYDNPSFVNYYISPNPDFLIAKGIVLRQFENQKVISYRDSFYLDASGNVRITYVYDTTLVERALFSITTYMPKISTRNDVVVYDYKVHIFCSKSPEIDPFAHREVLVDCVGGLYPDNSIPYEKLIEGKDNTADIPINKSTLLKAGFGPGDTVYCSGYVSPSYLYKYEYDFITRKYLPDLCSKNHTPTYSFVLQ
jgi:hypothetical protein